MAGDRTKIKLRRTNKLLSELGAVKNAAGEPLVIKQPAQVSGTNTKTMMSVGITPESGGQDQNIVDTADIFTADTLIQPQPWLASRSLIYISGVSQAPIGLGYNPKFVTYTATPQSAVGTGYNSTFSLKTAEYPGLKWQDGTTGNKSMTWSIVKAKDSLGLGTAGQVLRTNTNADDVTWTTDASLGLYANSKAVDTYTTAGNSKTLKLTGSGHTTVSGAKSGDTSTFTISSTDKYVEVNNSTNNANYPVLLNSNTATTTAERTAIVNSNITANPSTGNISAKSVTINGTSFDNQTWLPVEGAGDISVTVGTDKVTISSSGSNTAGANQDTNKLYLIGAKSQTTGSGSLQTYSNSSIYATNGSLTTSNLNTVGLSATTITAGSATISNTVSAASGSFTGTVSANTINASSSMKINGNTVATLASPAFTGTPTAPTPSAGDNSTKIATTAFVNTNGGKIDTIKLNGTTQTISDKTVNLNITAFTYSSTASTPPSGADTTKLYITKDRKMYFYNGSSWQLVASVWS